MNKVLNIAHRGAREFAPENTIPAFQKAKELGADMIEIDVRLTKDHEVVVHHDETLDRCTDVDKIFPKRPSTLLKDYYYKELKRLNTGKRFLDHFLITTFSEPPFSNITMEEMNNFIPCKEVLRYVDNKVGIPTLEKTLRWAKYNSMELLIELKTEPDTADDLLFFTINWIRHFGMEYKVVIQSFDHKILQKLALQSVMIRTILLVDDRRNQKIKNEVEYLRNHLADGYSFNHMNKLHINDLLGEEVMSLYAWTVNDPEAMKQLISAGVTGIISDFPNRVAEVLQQNKN
ncbi:MAG: glycerophosphodiester phosphodiesterase family protein [Bacilli bacterium]|nr:glycerophosphodiester phosphodiesterase family protein [Bacilli bacterium]